VIEPIDVLHVGVSRAICAFVERDEGWLVDPGPESAHGTLLEAIGDWRPDRILLTHIHLDHAGATGALVRRWPQVEVWVHERGARHLADPSRLVASAERIYGEDMRRLWGEIVAVPESSIRVLAGGERIDGWRVAYTPGHASHHVCYLHEATATAFVGDVGGVRIAGGPTIPPTPPPDIDLEAWAASLQLIDAWRARRLAITHFGLFDDPAAQLEQVRTGLRSWGELARTTDADAYGAAITAAVREQADESDWPSYLDALPPAMLHPGLERYWRTKNG
jgi:glyoxylase-like metal-dependent hydrolase (beta-lactamase superfamily II)